MTGSRGPALAVMGRVPVPGRVKTRLQPPLTPRECADLYRAFLLDALDLAASVERCTPFLAYAPPDRKDYFRETVPSPIHLLPQAEGDLGHRMYRIFQQLQESGHSPILIVGSDLPALQSGPIERAFACLEVSEVCLGPSTDGGYYLVGARRAHRCLFEGIEWSTDGVLSATIERARAAHLSLALVEASTDVDTYGDLLWLRGEIERLRRTRGARIPPRTASRLAEMGL